MTKTRQADQGVRMAENICPGKCNSRARSDWSAFDKAWEEWDRADPKTRGEAPEPPTTHVSWGNPWCLTCTASIRAALADLDEVMALRLHSADGHQSPGAQNERVTTSKTAASPSPGQDDQDELIRWLREIENDFRAGQSPPLPMAPARGTSAYALTQALAWLGTHLDQILHTEDLGEEFGLGVLARHRQLQEKTATKPPTLHKPLPCPKCKRFSLFLRPGDNTVCCRSSKDVTCGLIMTVSEYGRLEDSANEQVAS